MIFGSIFRWCQVLLYTLAGKTDKATEVLERNPLYLKKKVETLCGLQGQNINSMVEAVSVLTQQLELKENQLKRLSEGDPTRKILGIERLKTLKDGAAAMARKIVDELRGNHPDVSEEELKSLLAKDMNYQKCMLSFRDFDSSLREKEMTLENLRKEIEESKARLGRAKLQLMSMKRQLDQMKSRGAEIIADVISAEQERALNKALAGLEGDGSVMAEMQRLEEIDAKVRAEVRVTAELAGTDTAVAEEEFIQAAKTNVADDEFERAVFGGAVADSRSGREGRGKSAAAALPEK